MKVMGPDNDGLVGKSNRTNDESLTSIIGSSVSVASPHGPRKFPDTDGPHGVLDVNRLRGVPDGDGLCGFPDEAGLYRPTSFVGLSFADTTCPNGPPASTTRLNGGCYHLPEYHLKRKLPSHSSSVRSSFIGYP